MNEKNFQIPRRVREEMALPAMVGQRHGQMLRLASQLLTAGLSCEAIFAQLRSMYEGDVSDKEIQNVIEWMKAKKESSAGSDRKVVENKKQTRGDDSPAAVIERVLLWLKDFRCTEADLYHSSPWRPGEDWRSDGSMLLAGLYDAEDYINIVVDHTSAGNNSRKATPIGCGITLRRDGWLKNIRESGSPQSAAGAWVRPNPVAVSGSGNGGAFTDDDVTAYRFLLVESDILPPDLQLSIIAVLRLPVAAIIASGGRSFHAWIRVDASDANTYRAIAKRIFGTLVRFGFDPQNGNPSRLSRFPGALRCIGADGDGRQRLIYLNPDAAGNGSIFTRE